MVSNGQACHLLMVPVVYPGRFTGNTHITTRPVSASPPRRGPVAGAHWGLGGSRVAKQRSETERRRKRRSQSGRRTTAEHDARAGRAARSRTTQREHRSQLGKGFLGSQATSCGSDEQARRRTRGRAKQRSETERRRKRRPQSGRKRVSLPKSGAVYRVV